MSQFHKPNSLTVYRTFTELFIHLKIKLKLAQIINTLLFNAINVLVLSYINCKSFGIIWIHRKLLFRVCFINSPSRKVIPQNFRENFFIYIIWCLNYLKWPSLLKILLIEATRVSSSLPSATRFRYIKRRESELNGERLHSIGDAREEHYGCVEAVPRTP